MAMHIDITEPETGQAKSFVWHIGSPPPDRKYCGPKSQVEVYADGDELENILRNFQNLPIRKGARYMLWTGDFAKFIINNMGAKQMAERHIFIPVFQAAEFRDRLEHEMRLIAQEGQTISNGVDRTAIASIRTERFINWVADGMINPLPVQVRIPPEEIATRVKELQESA